MKADRLILTVWRGLCSLKAAVLIMSGLTLALIVATVLESIYDTPSAQYHVYQSWFFKATLFLLGVNILCVALDRLPWKRRHVEFLLAHAGILLLLAGSWVTQKYGIDGMLQVEEGGQSNVVEFQKQFLLYITESERRRVEIPWTPPHVEFKPFKIEDLGLTVSQWIPHADRVVKFESPLSALSQTHSLAVKIDLRGLDGAPPMMKLGTQEWLLYRNRNTETGRTERESFFSTLDRAQMGAVGVILSDESLESRIQKNLVSKDLLSDTAPLVYIEIPSVKPLQKNYTVSVYRPDSEKKIQQNSGRIVEKKTISPTDFKTKGLRLESLKFPVALKMLEEIWNAEEKIEFQPSAVLYGSKAPTGAIYIEEAKSWIALGERVSAELNLKGKLTKVFLAFMPERMLLPFEIQLNRFQVDFYPGSKQPKEYASTVDLKSGDKTLISNHVISMNEPLSHQGYTFYQASYQQSEGAPTLSVLSVNKDPGRFMKYLGSVLLVLGSAALFLRKVSEKNRSKKEVLV